MFKTLAPVAAILLVATPVAVADSSVRTWVQETDQLIEVDSSDAGLEANFKSLVRIITASGGDYPTVQLSCQITTSGHDALNLSVQLDPQNTYEDDPDRSPRFHHVSGIMNVQGETFPERYAFHAKSTKLIPLNRKVASRIYNSVVRGDDVTLKVRGKIRDLALPEANKAFKDFAKFCPVTNGGKFDDSAFEALSSMQLTPDT